MQPQQQTQQSTMVMNGITYAMACVNGQQMFVPVQQQQPSASQTDSRLTLLYAEREAERAAIMRREIQRESEIARLEAMRRGSC